MNDLPEKKVLAAERKDLVLDKGIYVRLVLFKSMMRIHYSTLPGTISLVDAKWSKKYTKLMRSST